MGEGEPYRVLKLGEENVGGLFQITPEMGEVSPNWATAFAVADTDATCAKTEELGGKVLVQPVDIPQIGRYAVVQDPIGAVSQVLANPGKLTVVRALVTASVAMAALVGTAFAATDVRVIQGDRNAGGIKIGRSAPADVRRLYGTPSTSRVESTHSCVQSWKGVRLVVQFFTFEGKPCARGVALIVTVTGRAAWRTAVGLRVGDPAARVRALYPRVRPRAGFAGDRGYWLVTRQICAEVGGGRYPGLLARIQRGRVSALVARISVCD